MATAPRRGAPEREGDTATKERPKVDPPRRYKVLFHNDDYTTMEFVILVLMRFFHKEETDAYHLMLTVHHKGMAVVGAYTRDIAETKAAAATDFARENGFPLLITSEPE